MSALIVVFFPIFFSFLLYVITEKTNIARFVALTLFLGMFGESIFLYFHLPQSGFMSLGHFLEIDYFDFTLTFAVDKLSVIMLVLTSILLLLVTLSSWHIEKSSAYFSLLVFFSGAIFGVFMSTNLLWFFIFWELTLIPMYFLIGIWGAEERVYAAVKFFLYTHVASMLILLAFFLLHKQSGTFDMTLIKESVLVTPALIWWLLFVGFAVKMPLFPFHTWLPDAHVQAPAPVSVLLAGVLLKMGAYAMIRMVLLMLPHQAQKYVWILLLLGVISLVYSAFMALYETHLKKMVAYSSISHMGLVAIAMATLSYDGLSSAVYEMIGHAFIIAPLFLIAGFFHHKTGSWQMQEMGGIMRKAPYISLIFIIAGLGALGFPATMGFVGEISILISSIEKYGLWLIVVAFTSMLSASYIIWTFRRVIYGSMSILVEKTDFSISKMEFFALIIFTFFIIVFGVYPQALFSIINDTFSSYTSLGGGV